MINSLFSSFAKWSMRSIVRRPTLQTGNTRNVVVLASTTSACRAIERKLKVNGLRTMAMIMALGIMLVAPIDPARARQADPALRSCRWEPVFGTWVFERHPYVLEPNSPFNVDEIQRAIGTQVNFTTHLVRIGRIKGDKFWEFGGTAISDTGMKGKVRVGHKGSISLYSSISSLSADRLGYFVTIDWENVYSDSQYGQVSMQTLGDLEKQSSPHVLISGTSSFTLRSVPTISASVFSDRFTISIPFSCIPIAVRTDIWMTNNADRPGSDYAHFIAADPNECRLACYDDSTCKAWTWVKPGVQAPGPRCYLKRPAPAETPNTCCISGLGYKPELPIPRLPFP